MKPTFNRAPLTRNTMTPLAPGAIRPEGWLLEQLKMQAEGITRAFEEVCPELERFWSPAQDGDLTRTIYYLEGIIYLGRALSNERYIERAAELVRAIIDSQREDGWFGPAENRDYRPLVLALRALRAYFCATNERAVLALMDKFFKYEYRALATHPMCEWDVACGGENMELALWLYNITGQKYLIELCKRLRAQTLDWPNYFHTFPNPMPMSRTIRWERLHEALAEEKDEPLCGEKRPYFHCQFHQTQGVNLAIGLKTPGIINLFKSGFKEQGGFDFGYEKLMKHHGLPNGMFSCDDHINGANPVQGVRLQAIVEMMNSMEALLALGNYGPAPADVLEKLAYNALAAAFSPRMDAYQRLQQVNQVRLSDEPHKWYNADADANLFRAAQNDIDCASCHMAYPKFVASLWYATEDDGLYAVSYAPCSVRTTLSGVPVRLRVSGGYPFMHSVEIEIGTKQPVDFPLYLRIPFWARQPMIYLPDGEIMQLRTGECAQLRRVWKNGDRIRLELPTVPRLTNWYHQSGAVEVGPLLMAHKLDATWSETPAGKCAVSSEKLGYALLRDEAMKLNRIEEDVSPFGTGESAVGVMVRAAQVDWSMDAANTAPMPMASKLERSSLDILELVPYADAPLRIAAFPMGTIRETKQKEIK